MFRTATGGASAVCIRGSMLQIARYRLNTTAQGSICRSPILSRTYLTSPFNKFHDLSRTRSLFRPSSPWQPSQYRHAFTDSQEEKHAPKPNFWYEITRIARLAKPEAKTLGLAITLLFISSAVTLSVPFAMGVLIDVAMVTHSTEGDSASGNAPSTEPAASSNPPNDASKPASPAPSSTMTSLTTFLNTRRDSSSPASPASAALRSLSTAQLFGGLACIFLIGAGANMGRVVLLRLAGERIVARLRSRLFGSVVRQDIGFFDKKENRTGDLVSRLSMDTNIIGKTITQNVSDGLRSTVQASIGFAMMVYVNAKLAGTMVFIVPPVAIAAIVYGRIVRDLARKTQDAVGEATKVAEEKLGNVRTVRAFSQEEAETKRYTERVQAIYDLARKEAFASGWFFGGLGASGNFLMLAILYYGGFMVSSGQITVGELASFFLYTGYAGSSLFGLSNFYSDLMKGVGASTRVFDLLEQRPKIERPPASLFLPSPTSKAMVAPEPELIPVKLEKVQGRITFENVTFSYPTRPDAHVFKDLTFDVEPGTHVAIVGRSGSGKSSIASLILRFYDPASGIIKIDGVDIKQLDNEWLRDEVLGVVPQEPVIFAGSVADNIAYARPESTREQVETVAVQANASQFIDSFPKSYDTFVGEKGAAISGGQKQRLAIARALLKNPKIFILDEATSSLDQSAEGLVQEAIDRLVEGRTVIAIAHRDSTIRKADRVLMVEAGLGVVESGSYWQLMGKKGKFWEMMKQKEADEEKANAAKGDQKGLDLDEDGGDKKSE
ncbi:P-loop containing nucleoside triphosphate hydrolase protein [Cladochytrium replicatum]|nr:P-loop containing nucleoside triphosphate hydrolase protein [Cladochytrium replicatum]